MAEPVDKSKNGWLVWALLGFVIVSIVVAFVRQERDRATYPMLPVISTVSDFSLTNQLGDAVSLADLKGQVWVANVIFTRCPGPCLTLSKMFSDLQEQLPENERIKLVSLTVDPEFDTPDVLSRYGKRLGTEAENWWFLTGENSQLRRLAIHDLQFVVQDKDEETMETEEDLFIHSTSFMIVDKQGRVRKVINSHEPVVDGKESVSAIDATLQTIEQLLHE